MMLMLGMGLPGAALLLRNDEHVQIDVVINYLSEKKKSFLNLVTSILGTVTCFFITWAGLWVTHDQYVRGVRTVGDLQIPKYILLVLIPLGTFFLTTEFIRKVKYYYSKLKEIK
jgi:TRAP-type C4-dicarboxylate transport system permease small subunit